MTELDAPTRSERGHGFPVFTLDRCALLTFEIPADGVAALPRRDARLRYRPVAERAVTVTSFGFAEYLRENGVTVEADGSLQLSSQVAGWARPVRVVLTELRISVTSADNVVWSSSIDDITRVVHSDTEPISVISASGQPDSALLVPMTEANSFRAAIDEVLGGVPEEDLDEDTETAPDYDEGQPRRRQLSTVRGIGDSLFRTGSWAAGLSVLAIMVLVGGFLLWLALPALRATGLSFLTTAEWQPDIHHFGIAAVLTFTILIALVALAVAVPLSIGTALFISDVVPRPLKQWSIVLVDLMAAVPSVVYGMWGRVILQDHAIGVSGFLATWFSWIPFFKVDGADPRDPLGSPTVYTASTFIAGIVVALMVIPITCSIMREVFSQAPVGEREGAYALGSTRWGMIRSVVLPFGKGGMIGAVMLGLGRALGETVAVYLIISPVFNIDFHLLQSGSNSVSSLIVLRQGDASGFGRSALLAAGLALFVITLIVNFSASSIVARTRSGAQSEA